MPYTEQVNRKRPMRFATPSNIQNLIYFGMDTRALANVGDEFIGIGIGRMYFGIYPTEHGMEFCWGITDHNGCL